MKKLVNSVTDKNVSEFINEIDNNERKSDCKLLLKIMKTVTGKSPRIWGRNIVGFGKYTYKRKDGNEFEWFHVGFSPAKNHLSVYLMYDVNEHKELLSKLGKHKTGKGCLYLKRLHDADINILKKLILQSIG